jgi:hypothetical protein
MSGGHRVHVEALAAGGVPTVMPATVPRGRTDLDVGTPRWRRHRGRERCAGGKKAGRDDDNGVSAGSRRHLLLVPVPGPGSGGAAPLAVMAGQFRYRVDEEKVHELSIQTTALARPRSDDEWPVLSISNERRDLFGPHQRRSSTAHATPVCRSMRDSASRRSLRFADEIRPSLTKMTRVDAATGYSRLFRDARRRDLFFGLFATLLRCNAGLVSLPVCTKRPSTKISRRRATLACQPG